MLYILALPRPLDLAIAGALYIRMKGWIFDDNSLTNAQFEKGLWEDIRLTSGLRDRHERQLGEPNSWGNPTCQ
ncbi:hypothetical protein OPV22_030684 [Ensete ventricosum]|uniref:Lipoxygenase domain-containing protein n=1 Tax=Ensete ventricosum TaxID=4639 RepID=A0AAV8P8J7_ENSVE|nr:hypothetical protein OPV22_030684 [Ensete ventricosum]